MAVFGHERLDGFGWHQPPNQLKVLGPIPGRPAMPAFNAWVAMLRQDPALPPASIRIAQALADITRLRGRVPLFEWEIIDRAGVLDGNGLRVLLRRGYVVRVKEGKRGARYTLTVPLEIAGGLLTAEQPEDVI
jgi:hypothetical protein